MKLIIGNITFHHFTEEEKSLFKDESKERKALVHDIDCVVECKDCYEAEKLGEDALQYCADSYLIPEVFEKNGEVAFECQNNSRAISSEDFKKDYLK